MTPLPRPTPARRSNNRLYVTHDRFGYPLKPGEVLRYARRRRAKIDTITPAEAAAMFDEHGRVVPKEEIERILRGPKEN